MMMMNMDCLPACIYVHLVPEDPDESVRSLGLKLDCLEHCAVRELNLSPLQGQSVFLTAGSALQPGYPHVQRVPSSLWQSLVA